TLFALHPSLDETGSATLASLNPGAIATADITVAPVGPTVVALTPADGAINQLVGSNVIVRFSETLAGTSVSSQTLSLELANARGEPTGALISGTVSLVNGTDVVFEPTRPLPPGRTFVAHFNGDVYDLGGVFFGGGRFSWTFSTSADVASGAGIDFAKIRLEIPINGVAQIIGEPGALPTVAGGNPWAVKPSVEGETDPVLETTNAATDGSFSCTVGHPPDYPVEIADTIWLSVIDPAGNEAARFRLGLFVTADGNGFLAPANRDSTFTTSEGITVDVPEGAFSEPTVVTVSTLDSTLGVDTPQGMALGAYVRVDFPGEANETLRLTVPAPADAPIGARVFIGDSISLPWGRKLRLLSVGEVIESGGLPVLSNHPSLQPEPFIDGAGNKVLDNDAQTCQDVRDEGLSECFIGVLLAELRFAADAAFYFDLGAEWSLGFGQLNGLAQSAQIISMALEGAWVFKPEPRNWDGQYVLPILLNQPFEIVSRDVAAGWVLGRQDYEPVLNPGGMFGLGILAVDDGPPLLVGARPFDLIGFSRPRLGSTSRLRLEIQAEGKPGGFTLNQHQDFQLSEGSTISVFEISQPDQPEVLQGPTSLCGGASPFNKPLVGRRALLVLGSGDIDPAGLLSLEFQFNRQLTGMDDLPASEVGTLTDLGPTDLCGGGSHTDIPLRLELSKDKSRLIFRLVGALPPGHLFEFKLTAGKITSAGRWYPSSAPSEFRFATRPQPGDSVADMDLGGNGPSGVSDLLQLGNLVMVATGEGELVAIDVSKTTEGSGAGSFEPHAVMDGAYESIRSLATDGHNRVFFNAKMGATWGVRAVRMEDVRDLSGATSCQDPPDWPGDHTWQCFHPVDGSVVVAHTTSAPSASEWLTNGTLPL
ncbi:MAG: Ig-like domain-containing protein, partial [bacterium]|nr:Ig-like domain-containing protein [bacterium]